MPHAITIELYPLAFRQLQELADAHHKGNVSAMA